MVSISQGQASRSYEDAEYVIFEVDLINTVSRVPAGINTSPQRGLVDQLNAVFRGDRTGLPVYRWLAGLVSRVRPSPCHVRRNSIIEVRSIKWAK